MTTREDKLENSVSRLAARLSELVGWELELSLYRPGSTLLGRVETREGDGYRDYLGVGYQPLEVLEIALRAAVAAAEAVREVDHGQ